ncbi:hypothetical protein NL676_019554 [Syzygium grande]|nr:hypothetical protein NL676_019554 [Syzygium grande]
MPVFYDVAPSDVLRQTGSYGEAINLHINKRRYTDETIQNWKAALSKVGALRGWELKERGKGEFTEEVVRTLLIELKKNYLAVSDYLVEMDDHVDKIMEVIGEQTTETKIVGIYGMGGVGKTTLATIIYNKLSANSTNCCFLSNFKDTKIEILQNQLISGIPKETCLPIHNSAEGITEIKKRLSSRKGTENVEAIRLKFDHQFQYFIEKEESESLSNLRFLQVDCVDLDENNVQHLPSTNQRNLLILRS